jgi:hypothetical protein
MNYNDWLKAVDQALKANGKPYTASKIDPNHLTASFNAGVSPVIYARQQYHPMAPVWTPPKYVAKPLSLPALSSNFLAWLFWTLSATGVAFCGVGSIFMLLGFMSWLGSSYSESEAERISRAIRGREQTIADFIASIIIGGPGVVLWFMGLICITLACLLQLAAKISGHSAAP